MGLECVLEVGRPCNDVTFPSIQFVVHACSNIVALTLFIGSFATAPATVDLNISTRSGRDPAFLNRSRRYGTSNGGPVILRYVYYPGVS